MKVPAQEIEIPSIDRATILREIDRLLTAGQLSGGRNIERFEAEFAQYTGVDYAVAVSSGTSALELIMLACDVRGKTVIVPANTNFATFVAAWRAGAHVVLCDIDPATLSPRVEDLEAVATADTKVVVLVHMGGFITHEITWIVDWCAARGIALVEDAAHAHGSRRDDRAAGVFGLAGGYSFFATKVMTSGEGGMVVTNNADLASEIRVYRNLGKAEAWISHHIRMGSNARMTELSAIIGRQQLTRLDENVAARRQVADRYAQLLGGTPGIRLLTSGHPYSGYKVVVMLDGDRSRKTVKTLMAEAGVQLAGEIYAEPLHHQPALHTAYPNLAFPGAELSCAQQICLPIYPTLDTERVDYVAACLTQVLHQEAGL